MTDPITIQGFATRYETLSRAPVTYDDDLPGIIARYAFADVLKLNLPVVLQHGGHESDRPALADTDDGTLLLFDSPLGLAFQAEIYPQEHRDLPEIIAEIRNGFGCSVDFQETKMTATTINGRAAWRMEGATCSHIALVSTPNFTSACCWIANRPIDSQNHRILLAQQQWSVAFHEYCLVAAKSLGEEDAPPLDAIAEAQRKLVMGIPKRRNIAVIPQPATKPTGKEPSNLKMTADLFKIVFASRDTMREQIAALEERINALEANLDRA